jgi:hypothetical protein
MSSSSSIEVSDSSSGVDSGRNKRKEHSNSSTDTKKVCKGSGVDSGSNKENLNDQIKTVTYNNDQTDTATNNNDQE